MPKGQSSRSPAPDRKKLDKGWMSAPHTPSNCPPGLEYLSTLDQLLVQQKIEYVEVFTGIETKNKYTVKNSQGQKVYYAVEESDFCTRWLCGKGRAFEMKIYDNNIKEVIHLERPFVCDALPCCLNSMEVFAPKGTKVGTVEQEFSFCLPQFSLKNAAGKIMLRIEGPFCTMSCCGSDVNFKVTSADGKRTVGKVTKQWSGLARELFTDADYFGINFPMDLDVKMKAVTLAACFLIDFMFYED